MIKSYVSASSLLLSCFAFVFFGIAAIIWRESLLSIVYLVTSGLLAIAGVVQLVTAVSSKPFFKNGLLKILSGLLTIGLGVLLYLDPDKFKAVLPILLGLYMMILAIIKLISFFQYTEDKLIYRLYPLVSGLVMIVFSVVIMSNPYESVSTVILIIGIFLIFYGSTYLIDFFREILPFKNPGKIKRHIRITLPVVFVSFMPKLMLSKINNFLQSSKQEEVPQSPVKDENQPDIEVFIHVMEKGTGVMGHMDLFYRGQVISYGCYDKASQKLDGGMGDGVLFTIDKKEKYVNFCNNYAGKTLFCFGLRLTEEQKKRVDQKMDEIFSYLYEWDPPVVEAMRRGETDLDKYKEYASRLYRVTGAKFYKFTKSSFKTYFVLTTNCVKLADEVIGSSGTDVLGMNGLVTPGTYYDYLNREYTLRNGIVISREVYRNNPEQKEIVRG